MVTLSKEQLREVQLTELEILKEAHRICEKHGIPYVIIAGTLLGAVRHQGFIPWDDDVDIAMLRPDYERFREACETELDRERFVFQDDRNTPGYRWGYGKLRRKDTLFLREHQEHMPYFQGIFLDVFPLDEVPAPYMLRRVFDLRCYIIRKFLWAKAGKRADGRPLYRALYGLMDLVPEKAVLGAYHRLIGRSRAIERKARAEEERGRRRKRFVRILMFPAPNGAGGYLRGWYTHRKRYVFEDGSFWGVRNADDYLRFKFGDYMTPPAEEERKTHPISRLKLLSESGTGADRA